MLKKSINDDEVNYLMRLTQKMTQKKLSPDTDDSSKEERVWKQDVRLSSMVYERWGSEQKRLLLQK